MKKKIVVIVLVVLLAVIVGLQMFLSYGLTSSFRKWVFPIAKERFNLDVTMDHITVNLFAGAMTIHGLQVANPAGFSEPDLVSVRQFGLDIGLISLFRGGIADIQKVSIKDACMIIVRNQKGQINIQEVIKEIQKGTSGEHQAAVPEGADEIETSGSDTEEKKLPDMKIQDMNVNTLINYIDYHFSEEPVKLGVEIHLLLKHIANYGNEDELSGTVNLQGKFSADKKEGKFNLDGRIAPVVDPTRMSFIITGTMQPIDLTVFQPFAEKYGMKAGLVSGTVNLLCDKGDFDPEKSEINLTFNQVQLSKKLSAKLQGVEAIETFTVVVPVGGTLINPKIDIGEAIMQTLFSGEVINTILSGILKKQAGGADLLKSKGAGQKKDFDLGGMIRGVMGKKK